MVTAECDECAAHASVDKIRAQAGAAPLEFF